MLTLIFFSTYEYINLIRFSHRIKTWISLINLNRFQTMINSDAQDQTLKLSVRSSFSQQMTLFPVFSILNRQRLCKYLLICHEIQSRSSYYVKFDQCVRKYVPKCSKCHSLAGQWCPFICSHLDWVTKNINESIAMKMISFRID